MSSFYRLYKNELWRNIATIRHYPFALIINIVQILAVSALVVWLLVNLGYSVSSVGTVLWPLIMLGLSSPSSSLSSDIEIGTFEQIYTSGQPILKLLVTRVLAEVTVTIPGNLLVLLVIIWLFPGQLNLLPLFIVTAIAGGAAFGLGLIFAGLTLRYRSIGGLINLLMFVAMIVSVVDLTAVNKITAFVIGGIIPLVGPIVLLQLNVLGESIHIIHWLVAIFNLIFYCFIGIVLFKTFYVKARLKGMLGRY
ncbi:ABC-2 type transporter [compost metagenome]